MPSDNVEARGARQTLDQLRPISDSTLRPYNVLVGRNLGNMTITMALPMYQFFGMSAVANDAGLAERQTEEISEIAQRKLDPTHAKKLALYLLRALVENCRLEILKKGRTIPAVLQSIQDELGHQPYFATQPIVANLRNCEPGGKGIQVEPIQPGFARVFLSDADVLWVIDGQHRRFAMDFLFEFLGSLIATRKYSKRGALYSPRHSDVSAEELAVWSEIFQAARQSCNVIVDIHLGLTTEQERQVFHDLNNLGKPVAAGLAFQFDSSNPVNLFIKEQLVEGGVLHCPVAEHDTTDWHNDDGAIAYKDLVAINARLLVNKTTISSASPAEVKPRLDTARRFWLAVSSIPHWGHPGAKSETVAAQPVVLKAAAKIVYDCAFGREADPQFLEAFLAALSSMDLSHNNPCWRYYVFDQAQRTSLLPGLDIYLPPVGDGANRDIGGWNSEERIMRFGAKHNDIFPIIGDMMRWMARLPSRHAENQGEPAA
jgi:DNA-sulfur modification-associated